MLLSVVLCVNFNMYLWEIYKLEIIYQNFKKLNLIYQKIFNAMNSSFPVLSINLLPPEKLYCNFSYWSSLFSQDMQILWDRAHGVPLVKLPKGVSDMIFPYLLLALSDYKTSQINKMNGIGLDNLLSLWFDKYLLNKNGYFELIKNNFISDL